MQLCVAGLQTCNYLSKVAWAGPKTSKSAVFFRWLVNLLSGSELSCGREIQSSMGLLLCLDRSSHLGVERPNSTPSTYCPNFSIRLRRSHPSYILTKGFHPVSCRPAKLLRKDGVSREQGCPHCGLLAANALTCYSYLTAATS